jgi:hypothetical protein
MTGLSKTKRGPAIVRDPTEVASARTRATAEGGYKKRHSYKPLPRRFRHNGFDYRQIAREEDVAWGVDGWAVQDKEAAFRKFREVVERDRTTRSKKERLARRSARDLASVRDFLKAKTRVDRNGPGSHIEKTS